MVDMKLLIIMIMILMPLLEINLIQTQPMEGVIPTQTLIWMET